MTHTCKLALLQIGYIIAVLAVSFIWLTKPLDPIYHPIDIRLLMSTRAFNPDPQIPDPATLRSFPLTLSSGEPSTDHCPDLRLSEIDLRAIFVNGYYSNSPFSWSRFPPGGLSLLLMLFFWPY